MIAAAATAVVKTAFTIVVLSPFAGGPAGGFAVIGEASFLAPNVNMKPAQAKMAMFPFSKGRYHLPYPTTYLPTTPTLHPN